MRVVVPAVPSLLRGAVVPAILAEGWPAEVVPVHGSLFAYGQLVAELWRAGADFVIVEHDVVVTEPADDDGPPHCRPAMDTLTRFASCEHWWCAHSYDVAWGNIAEVYGAPYGLGCTRFRAPLMAAFPSLVDDALSMDLHPNRPPGSWGVLDSAISHQLKVRGVRVHRHLPDVRHLHRYTA